MGLFDKGEQEGKGKDVWQHHCKRCGHHEHNGICGKLMSFKGGLSSKCTCDGKKVT